MTTEALSALTGCSVANIHKKRERSKDNIVTIGEDQYIFTQTKGIGRGGKIYTYAPLTHDIQRSMQLKIQELIVSIESCGYALWKLDRLTLTEKTTEFHVGVFHTVRCYGLSGLLERIESLGYVVESVRRDLGDLWEGCVVLHIVRDISGDIHDN